MHHAWILLAIGCATVPAEPVRATPPPPPPQTAAKEGLVAPSFSLPRVNGPGRMGLPTGKVTVVAFLATWNEPAKKSLRGLQAIADKGAEVLGVFVDDEPTYVPEFLSTYGARFPGAWDEGHAVADRFRPTAMPSFYLLDRAGTVRFVHRGYHDGEADEMAREVDSLLR